MRASPQVAIVVLNWNSPEDTLACLASTARSTYKPLEVYVVDNGSTDGSPDRIAETFPDVRLIRLPQNRGYGGGMNAGIRAGLAEGSDYVLCLNNDMTVDPGFLEPLVKTASVGNVVPFPAIYQADTPGRLDSAGNRFDPRTGLVGAIGHGYRDVPKRSEADYTELPFLPRRLLESVGVYDESYFAFYEDVELCLRIREQGWRFVLVPEARVFHRRGTTTRRIPGLVSYYSIRNRLRVVRTSGSAGHFLSTGLHVLFLTLPFHFLNVSNPASGHSLRHLLLGAADGLLPWRWNRTREWVGVST